MKVFETNISHQVSIYLKDNFKSFTSFELANQIMFEACGIKHFFEDDDFSDMLQILATLNNDIVEEPDREEYGDFQTNSILANKVTLQLSCKGISPELVIEPTCGKGNFIIASLKNFKNIKAIFGIEIYKPYVWETKFNILDYFLSNANSPKPEIEIIHSSVFDFDFQVISKQFQTEKLLIIGNPPWVTNSKLGSLNSTNLPKKNNFKKQTGLDAITGKGNFDIAEYISIMLLDAFQTHTGFLSLLVKNTVVKNIVFEQNAKKYQISRIEKYCIDSKKEFNVSVEASMLFCKLNSKPSFDCEEFDFYTNESKLKFGWLNSKFVSNIDNYLEASQVDNICPFVWRQGIKHDCTAIMELERVNSHFVNNLSQNIKIEEDLVFGFLKSSDLKNTVMRETRKYTIVTQRKVGQETNFIKELYPQTYEYLNDNLDRFTNRKSSIYNGKPKFSIFGVGDYSFKPFKVAISGLYKTFHFTLVLPQNGKPVMLDDTCYFIGFDKIEYAVYSIILLNSKLTEDFLRSITFSDAKRVFTKDLLMRLDLFKLSQLITQQEIEEQIIQLNEKYCLNVDYSKWAAFLDEMQPEKDKQMTLFD
ncbi:MAG: hypothetical protein H6Q20_1246 [Bacteroidetes bacterium]|nr:hypothetical protein [Bacteroidota bacterium]